MPKTSESAKSRAERTASKASIVSGNIVKYSPDSESKAAMKDRASRKWQQIRGDSGVLSDPDAFHKKHGG